MKNPKGGRPLPKWSNKILKLKINYQYTIYEMCEIFGVSYFSISEFIKRLNIKPNGYLKKNRTRHSYYESNNLIVKYLEILKNGHTKKQFNQKRFIKLAKLFAERSSNKRKDLFVDILS
ncbi:MAG: hypothetical protein K2X69_14140 [Silvanigrellaceae bacterium]|nr:hypothetical protein [Silvanigrellaceae bacterium]